MRLIKRLLSFKGWGRLMRVYGRSLITYGTPKKIWNAARTELAYRTRQTAIKTPPYLIFIEPLYYCNLSCPLCQRQSFAGARDEDAGKLPIAIYEKILDEIGDYLFQCHIFGLGEPLLDWPLTRRIIEKAHKKRIFTLVSTNCTLITAKIAREIVSCGLDYLVCAIDGVSQEAYEKYRVGGKVEKCFQGLRLLAEERRRQGSRMTIEWQYLVNRYNAHEMEEARALAREIGVYIRFAPMGGMEWDDQLQQYWLPEKGGYQEARLTAGRTKNPWHCYWLWRGVVVNSNGQLARCPGYQNVAMMGRLEHTKVMDIYDGPQSRRARELFKKGPVAEGPFPSPCNNCSYYVREHGGENLDKAHSANPQLAEV